MTVKKTALYSEPLFIHLLINRPLHQLTCPSTPQQLLEANTSYSCI